jgi:uncharacterized membrane protein YdjX (TVP38/TMEM64 family)
MSTTGAASVQAEARNWLPTALSVLAVACVLFLVVFGQSLFGLDRAGIDSFMGSVRDEPGAAFAVVVVFCSLALIGFPQAILFGVTVAVFGPILGALYAWSATMVSSAMTFGLGRFTGIRWTARLPEGTLRDISGVLQRRGVLASMVVRWTPSAPFIVVNAVCGASGMAAWRFLLGTGLGIVPKLLIIAFFTEQLEGAVGFFTSGDPKALGLLVVAALLWAAFIMFCRYLYKRSKTNPFRALQKQPVQDFSVTATQEPAIKAKSSGL